LYKRGSAAASLPSFLIEAGIATSCTQGWMDVVEVVFKKEEVQIFKFQCFLWTLLIVLVK
jgi:hypothetical protein